MTSARRARLQKELDSLLKDPPCGIVLWEVESKEDFFEASITGPEDTPYRGGRFTLEIEISSRYPFEPPSFRN